MAAAKEASKKTGVSLKYILTVAAVVVFFGVCAAVGMTLKEAQYKKEAIPVAATLNGFPITAREIETRLTEGRGYIRNYFEKKYDMLKEDASFWDKDFDGTTPMAYGRDYYYKEALLVKMTQLQARKYGLVKDISYTSFLERWEDENARRLDTVDKGGTIYGLVQYSESDYFQNEYAALEDKLFETLRKKNKFPVTQEEMQAYYDENRERLYKIQDNYTFEVVTAAISPSTEDGEDPTALAAIQAFEARLNAGEDFASLAKQVEKGEFPGLVYSVVEVKEEADKLELEKVSSLLECAKELELNQVSPLLVSKFYYYSIGRYTAYQKNGYDTFDNPGVQNNITYALQAKKYGAYIQELVDKADVRLNDAVYDSIVLPEKYR